MAIYTYIEIQMKRKELSKTFMMISKGKKIYMVSWFIHPLKDDFKWRIEGIKIFIMTHNIGIQMKRAELIKTFMMILNW